MQRHNLLGRMLFLLQRRQVKGSPCGVAGDDIKVYMSGMGHTIEAPCPLVFYFG